MRQRTLGLLPFFLLAGAVFASAQNAADSKPAQPEKPGMIPRDNPWRGFDRGIYATPGDGKWCANIVSYNFSAGDNPRLQSVTTCTPVSTMKTMRAEHKPVQQPDPRMVIQVSDTK